jgi:hypothetical protein
VRTDPVKLTEGDLEPGGDDFVLPIELPDGKRIQVVIPTFGRECYEAYAYKRDATYWLNFVTNDHYI